MTTLKHLTFTEEPSNYLVCSRTDLKTDATCVIVEDNPGPYLDFVQDLVEEGSFRMVMTAPFTDKTIQLLQGYKVGFGDDDEKATVQISNPAHCIVILDMRNGDSKTTEQTFTGYDPERFELAGYQFFLQFGVGFPGKVFIATHYGREHLRKEGIEGAFGIVDINTKSDLTTGKLPAYERGELQKTIKIVLNQFAAPNFNTMKRDGGTVDITFHGDSFTMSDKQSILAFMEVVRAGETGISDGDLAQRIGYSQREKKGKVADTDTTGEDSEAYSLAARASDGAEGQDDGAAENDGADDEAVEAARGMLDRLMRALKGGKIKGVSHAAVCRELGLDSACVSKMTYEDVKKAIKSIYLFACEINPEFLKNPFSFQHFLNPKTDRQRVSGRVAVHGSEDDEDGWRDKAYGGDTDDDVRKRKDVSADADDSAGPVGGTVFDRSELKKGGYRVGRGAGNGLISFEERKKAIEQYLFCSFIKIPSLTYSVKELEMALAQKEIDVLRQVESLAKQGEMEAAVALKRSFREEQKTSCDQIRVLKEELREVSAIRDNAYRTGCKSKPKFAEGESGKILGYVGMQKMSNVANYMSKLVKRVVSDLKQHCDAASSQAFIEHVRNAWLRQEGTHVYTGQEKWQL